jgi:hypothetical protein
MLQDCIAHISNRDAVLLNILQAYNKVSAAAVVVGFKSSILDMAELTEAQAAELMIMRDALTEAQGDSANLQKTLAVVTGMCAAVLDVLAGFLTSQSIVLDMIASQLLCVEHLLRTSCSSTRTNASHCGD